MQEIVWTAEHHTHGVGHAYALDTWYYRFRAPDVGKWQTVEGHTLKLDAETGRTTEVTDPSRPSRATLLDSMQAVRTR